MSQSNTRVIADLKVGAGRWQVESHCGVVRIITSAGHVVALNPVEASRLGEELHVALDRAALSVDSAQRGGPR